MEMKIQVPEQIVIVSETVSRILRLESCINPQEVKDYLQAVKLGYEIDEVQERLYLKSVESK
jgi:hypothetical protein